MRSYRSRSGKPRPCVRIVSKRNHTPNAHVKFVKAVMKSNLFTSFLVRRGRLDSWTDKCYCKNQKTLSKGQQGPAFLCSTFAAAAD